MRLKNCDDRVIAVDTESVNEARKPRRGVVPRGFTLPFWATRSAACTPFAPQLRYWEGPCDHRAVKTENLPKGLRKELVLAQSKRGGLTLTFYDRAGSRSVALTPGGRWVIGRDASSDLQLDERSVSGMHALVAMSEVGLFIEDLGSRNGTWVNGERVERVALRPGDLVGIGAAQGVVASLQRPGRDLKSHEHFVARVSQEIARARDHQRPFALGMVDAESGSHSHVAFWAGRLAELARSYQLVGCYASNCVELLLPELEQQQAADLLATLCERAELSGQPAKLRVRQASVAFPGEGRDAASLIYTLRRKVLHEGSARRGPVQPFLPPERWLPDDVRKALERLAPTRATVLVVGETGTGKERLAHELHLQSARSKEPFVPLNCAAIPEHLAESVLFGHRAGAFTGAYEAQEGVFASAAGGTLFLDAIDALSPRIQGVLRDVLEAGLFRPVGASTTLKSRARVVAATHRDVDRLVADGSLRQDLRHRLGATAITLPPLRGRRALIAELAHHFARLSAQENDVPEAELPADVIERFCDYAWPGNMRELRNVVERGVLLAEEGALQLASLPEAIIGANPRRESAGEQLEPGSGKAFKERVERFERSLLLEALREAGWNQSDAARTLGIPRRTMVRKIKALGIDKIAGEGD